MYAVSAVCFDGVVCDGLSAPWINQCREFCMLAVFMDDFVRRGPLHRQRRLTSQVLPDSHVRFAGARERDRH